MAGPGETYFRESMANPCHTRMMGWVSENGVGLGLGRVRKIG
jgi:hypothetical protein